MSKYYYPYFTDGEAEAQRLSDFSKAPQQVSGRSRISTRGLPGSLFRALSCRPQCSLDPASNSLQ